MSDSPDAAAQLRLACVAATERLADALAVLGFREQENRAGTWVGRITNPTDGAGTVVAVTIPAEYPFQRPRVSPLDQQAAEASMGSSQAPYHQVGNSWHRERHGELCLFDDADHTQLPWADPAALIDQIQKWLSADRNGWPDDDLMLDLERYLPRTGQLILVENDLLSRIGRIYHLERSPQVLGRVLGARDHRPRNHNWRWRDDLALVLDFGHITLPITDWESLLVAAGDQADRLRRDVFDGLRELIVCYRRGEHAGALGLSLLPADGSVMVQGHIIAQNTEESRVRRSHPDATQLGSRRVAVVGLGAVGSVVADLLHRSGVGTLHLVDPDIVLPGNPVRHLVDARQVGRTKIDAVAEQLSRRRSPACTVDTSFEAIVTLDQAVQLLTGFHLVVDATADSTASAVLAAAADAGAGRLVSVAILADGYAIRIDHRPVPLGSDPLPEPRLPPPVSGSVEIGCSSPVSTTPPAAVWEAAAMAVRHTIDALLELPCPAGEERVLRPQVAS